MSRWCSPLVVFLLFVWTTPRHSAAAAASSSSKVITMGDSYASGQGIHKLAQNYDDPVCYAEYDTIPGGLYAASRGLDHVVTACAGSTINDTAVQWDDLQERYPDDLEAGWDGSLFLVSVGGQSVRSLRGQNFSQGLQRCFVRRRCHKDELNKVGNLDQVEAELESLVTTMVQQAPNATIRFFGYPKLFNPGFFGCFQKGFSRGEARFFDDLMGEMNGALVSTIETVSEAYPDVNVAYVDVRPFFNNGACALWPLRDMNQLRFVFSIPTFHPTQRGYNHYYNALLTNLNLVS